MVAYGNSYEETIGIITAGTEIMVGQPAKVARGWRTIGANILAVAEQSDRWTAANGKVNVALKDQEGNLRSTHAILTDLYPQWKTLNDEEKSNLALSIAGKMILARVGLNTGKRKISYLCYKQHGCLKILAPNLYSNILVA